MCAQGLWLQDDRCAPVLQACPAEEHSHLELGLLPLDLLFLVCIPVDVNLSYKPVQLTDPHLQVGRLRLSSGPGTVSALPWSQWAGQLSHPVTACLHPRAGLGGPPAGPQQSSPQAVTAGGSSVPTPGLTWGHSLAWLSSPCQAQTLPCTPSRGSGCEGPKPCAEAPEAGWASQEKG